jgi:hypothetical protein
MIRIAETETEFTIEWLKHYAHKYGSDKVYLQQDENKLNYIVVETNDENRSYDVSFKSSCSKGLSPSELESVPF